MLGAGRRGAIGLACAVSCACAGSLPAAPDAGERDPEPVLPSAFVVSGEVRHAPTSRFPDELVIGVELQLWFSEGRAPGREVVAVRVPAYSIQPLARHRGTIGADGSISIDGSGFRLTAGPDDVCVDVELATNVASPGDDQVALRTGIGVLCRSSDVPEPSVGPVHGAFGLLRPIVLATNVPIDAEHLDEARFVAGNTRLTASWDGRIVLSGGRPPASPIVLQGTVRDALGRVVNVALPQPLVPEGVLADPEFDVAMDDPRSRQGITGDARMRDGKLVFDATRWGAESAVVALGGLDGADSLRFRGVLRCRDQESSVQVRLVDASGVAAPVPFSCGDVPGELVVTLPGAGPWFLSIEDLTAEAMPWSVGPTPDGMLAIDWIRPE